MLLVIIAAPQTLPLCCSAVDANTFRMLECWCTCVLAWLLASLVVTFIKGGAVQSSFSQIIKIPYSSFPLPQVDEIYHDESLGTNINIVLVRMIMVGYRQVSLGETCQKKIQSQAEFMKTFWCSSKFKSKRLRKLSLLLENERCVFFYTSINQNCNKMENVSFACRVG